MNQRKRGKNTEWKGGEKSGKGTTFKIYLPRIEDPPDKIREKAVMREHVHRNEVILVVEDEDEVRKLAPKTPTSVKTHLCVYYLFFTHPIGPLGKIALF